MDVGVCVRACVCVRVGVAVGVDVCVYRIIPGSTRSILCRIFDFRKIYF